MMLILNWRCIHVYVGNIAALSLRVVPIKGTFKVAKAVIRSLKSKKERVHNSQIERDKRTNNDPQNIRRKLKIEQHEPLYKSDVLS
jgi:hypothetical protein